jgi:hypothetical protein
MLVAPLQAATLLVVAVYLIHARMMLQRRNRRLWHDLAAQIEPSVIKRGSLARFHLAGILLQMADYAERNGADADSWTQLKNDAMALRMSTLLAMIRLSGSRAAH